MRQVPFYSHSLAFALLTDPKDLTVAVSFLSYEWETLCNLIVEIHFCLNQDSFFFFWDWFVIFHSCIHFSTLAMNHSKLLTLGPCLDPSNSVTLYLSYL